MAAETRAHAEALLLKADKVYGIHAGGEGVQKALSHSEDGSVYQEWVTRHLGPDNLLTPDELAIYTALDKMGKVDNMSASQDLTQVQEVFEEEIKRATEELQRSTQMLQEQTEALQIQSQALDRSIQKRTGSERRRRDLEIVQQRKWENSYKQLSGEVEGIGFILGQRIEDLAQEASSFGPRARSIVNDSLQTDDRLLTSLQKLGLELGGQDPQEAENIAKMRETCLRLIKLTVETVRTRLDRVFLETLTSSAYQYHSAPPSATEIKNLGDELESLYAEILPVAQMSVEQQRLEPAIKRTSTRDGQRIRRSAVALHYISECLDHLQEKVHRLSQQIKSGKDYYDRSSHITATGLGELAVSSSTPAEPPQASVPPSPIRRPSPIRMRADTGNSASRRRSSGILETPAIEDLLESLAIKAPTNDGPSDTRLVQLSQSLHERTVKRDDMMKNSQDSYETITTSHLDDLRTAVQTLSDSALAETTFSEIKFIDADFEASIKLLRSEVDQAQDSLARLEMKNTRKRSEKKEDLVGRWTT